MRCLDPNARAREPQRDLGRLLGGTHEPGSLSAIPSANRREKAQLSIRNPTYTFTIDDETKEAVILAS